MKSAKQEALALIERMPEQASMEAILPELHFKARVIRGLEQFERGEVIEQEEMEDSVRQWLRSTGP